VTLEELLAHSKPLADAVNIPVNADFEDGLAVEPEGVGANVTKAVATGIAGLSIEDSTRDGGEPLYAFNQAVDRIKAARAAIDTSGSGVLLTARSEGFIRGRPDLTETIKRLQAFAAAGADCLFAPGLSKKEDIAAVVHAVAPKPVNLIGALDHGRGGRRPGVRYQRSAPASRMPPGEVLRPRKKSRNTAHLAAWQAQSSISTLCSIRAYPAATQIAYNARLRLVRAPLNEDRDADPDPPSRLPPCTLPRGADRTRISSR
jgi:hypothetical protein